MAPPAFPRRPIRRLAVPAGRSPASPNPLNLGERTERRLIAFFQILPGRPQIGHRLVIKIESEGLAQLAELLPRDDDFLRNAILIHHDFLLNCDHDITISAPPRFGNGASASCFEGFLCRDIPTANSLVGAKVLRMVG